MPTLFCMKSGARSHASLCTAGSAFGHDKYENVQCGISSNYIHGNLSRGRRCSQHLYAASSPLKAKYRCSHNAYQRSWHRQCRGAELCGCGTEPVTARQSCDLQNHKNDLKQPQKEQQAPMLPNAHFRSVLLQFRFCAAPSCPNSGMAKQSCELKKMQATLLVLFELLLVGIGARLVKGHDGN